MTTVQAVARLAAFLISAVVLTACGGGGGSAPAAPTPTTAPGNVGALRVALTDAPSCGFDQVVVTVERVRVHQSAGANENDSGWSDIVISPPKKVDLLSLQNGILLELGQTTLTAGLYTQLRLLLSPNGSGAPANYVVPTNGSMTPTDTPSAQQSGLKLIHPFTIEAGKTTALVLDFDACKSIVRRGNGSFGLKPVIGVMPMTLTAIVGYVQAGVTGVTVTAQKGGIVYRATQPNASGQFVLAPVDPTKGPYDVVFTGPNVTTAVIASVPVVTEQTTILNVVSMPSSPSGTAAGKVDLPGAAATVTGSVRALQKIGSGPTVEVAHVNADPTTGVYSLLLPTASPRLLMYSNPMVTPLDFQVQDDSARKYKLEASATGYVTQLGSEITVTVGTPLGGQDFSLVAAP